MEFAKRFKIRARMNLVISLSAVILVFVLAYTAFVFERSRIKSQVDTRAIGYLVLLNDITAQILEQNGNTDSEVIIKQLEPHFKNVNFIGSGYFFLVNPTNGFVFHPNQTISQADIKEVKEIVKSSSYSTKNLCHTQEKDGIEEVLFYIKKVNTPGNYLVVAKVYTSEAYSEIGKMVVTMLGFAPVAFSLFFIVVIFFSNTLIRPLRSGVSFAKEISEGNLTATISVERHDEIGTISLTLNKMAIKLNEVVVGIKNISKDVSLSSSQISVGSQSLASGSNEQATTVEELASSIEELTSTLGLVTENAIGANKITEEAANKIVKIGDSSIKSNQAVTQISERIKIITEIAFQTNILALNAAVEAARAGEYGKGFSVVASEVRKLAERSKQAADEISSLSIQTLGITSKANALLQKLIPEVQRTATLIDEVVATATEQQRTIDTVNVSIQELNDVSQQNSNAADGLATGGDKLNEQANEFLEMIKFFRVK
jgi:methyl-accepting chemotaxis protein